MFFGEYKEKLTTISLEDFIAREVLKVSNEFNSMVPINCYIIEIPQVNANLFVLIYL